jgi:hypothetical protein
VGLSVIGRTACRLIRGCSGPSSAKATERKTLLRQGYGAQDPPPPRLRSASSHKALAAEPQAVRRPGDRSRLPEA